MEQNVQAARALGQRWRSEGRTGIPACVREAGPEAVAAFNAGWYGRVE